MNNKGIGVVEALLIIAVVTMTVMWIFPIK